MANARPKLKVVKPQRSPAREKLAEAIDDVKALHADIKEAEQAAEKARAMLADLDAEFARLIASDEKPDADSRLADFVAGRLDIRGEGEHAKAYNAKLADLEAQHRNLATIRDDADKAAVERRGYVLRAERRIDECAREVLEEVVDIAALEKRTARAKAEYEKCLAEAQAAHVMLNRGSDAGNRAHRLMSMQASAGGFETLEQAPLRVLWRKLQSDPDATL